MRGHHRPQPLGLWDPRRSGRPWREPGRNPNVPYVVGVGLWESRRLGQPWREPSNDPLRPYAAGFGTLPGFPRYRPQVGIGQDGIMLLVNELQRGGHDWACQHILAYNSMGRLFARLARDAQGVGYESVAARADLWRAEIRDAIDGLTALDSWVFGGRDCGAGGGQAGLGVLPAAIAAVLTGKVLIALAAVLAVGGVAAYLAKRRFDYEEAVLELCRERPSAPGCAARIATPPPSVPDPGGMVKTLFNVGLFAGLAYAVWRFLPRARRRLPEAT